MLSVLSYTNTTSHSYTCQNSQLPPDERQTKKKATSNAASSPESSPHQLCRWWKETKSSRDKCGPKREKCVSGARTSRHVRRWPISIGCLATNTPVAENWKALSSLAVTMPTIWVEDLILHYASFSISPFLSLHLLLYIESIIIRTKVYIYIYFRVWVFHYSCQFVLKSQDGTICAEEMSASD